MSDTKSIYSILNIGHCTETIFSALPRAHLKSLRLIRKDFNHLVTQQSNLFSRAYISCAEPDIRAFKLLATSHLREYVTELVWDTTVGPPVNVRLTFPHRAEDFALIRIMGSWSDDARKGVDLKIFLRNFAVFPKLNSVVFTELMGSLVHTTQPENRPYESPAMRSWLKLELGPLPHIPASTETPLRFDMVTTTIDWAMNYIRREDAAWIPHLELGRYTSATSRAPILFLVAMSVLQHNSKRFLVEATSEKFALHGINDSSWMKKLDVVASPRDTALTGEPYDPLQSLQHLFLGLDNRKEEWEHHTNRLLQAVKALRLRELELSLVKKECPYNITIPDYTQIQKLVLKKFVLTNEELKSTTLEWCYHAGLESLHLVDCEIITRTDTRRDVVQWLIELHIRPYNTPTFGSSPETEPLDMGSREFVFYNRLDLLAGGPLRQLNVFFDKLVICNVTP
ncbi:uncharacterized protein APUU_51434A [Aspergillus puulaauensis]|uniref:Uncharacterized protein n=1 Tax=Aspergillus puulaauensis TaxID=1220207 RepID=A0A7R8ARB4_9EURO|nr:uncharacterized protein APUU_51434A [Aspergillus puulaauensis]BCS26723.1 hypothetical protein APUU_51434A [Aspergillus puulaauensis]